MFLKKMLRRMSKSINISECSAGQVTARRRPTVRGQSISKEPGGSCHTTSQVAPPSDKPGPGSQHVLVAGVGDWGCCVKASPCLQTRGGPLPEAPRHNLRDSEQAVLGGAGRQNRCPSNKQGTPKGSWCHWMEGVRGIHTSHLRPRTRGQVCAQPGEQAP